MGFRPNLHRLAQPDGCNEDVYDLLICCWDDEPKKRPKFSDIVWQVNEIIDEVTEEGCPPARDIGVTAEANVRIDGNDLGDEEEFGDGGRRR